MSSAVESHVHARVQSTLRPPARAIVVQHVNLLVLYVLTSPDIISINGVRPGRRPSMITITQLTELVASIVIYGV